MTVARKEGVTDTDYTMLRYIVQQLPFVVLCLAVAALVYMVGLLRGWWRR